jgi:hypothetical protein
MTRTTTPQFITTPHCWLCPEIEQHTVECRERQALALEEAREDADSEVWDAHPVLGLWVERALANDLPMYSTHNGAFAYLPKR